MQNSNYLSNEKGIGVVRSSKETLHSAELAPGERIDDLQLNGLSLIQSADAFRFGTDSVLLAHFAHVNAKEYCVDLGAGAGFCFTAEQAVEFLELKLTHGKRIVFCVPFV